MRFPSKESQALWYSRNASTLPRDWNEQQRLSAMNMVQPGWAGTGPSDLPQDFPIGNSDDGIIPNTVTTVQPSSRNYFWLVIVAAYLMYKRKKRF
jgi:hypothetical protein